MAQRLAHEVEHFRVAQRRAALGHHAVDAAHVLKFIPSRSDGIIGTTARMANRSAVVPLIPRWRAG